MDWKNRSDTQLLTRNYPYPSWNRKFDRSQAHRKSELPKPACAPEFELLSASLVGKTLIFKLCSIRNTNKFRMRECGSAVLFP